MVHFLLLLVSPPLRCMRTLHLSQPPELEVDIRPPPPEALHHDAATEMFRIRPAER